ncbi:hypothetical protein [Streptomyces lavendulae]
MVANRPSWTLSDTWAQGYTLLRRAKDRDRGRPVRVMRKEL